MTVAENSEMLHLPYFSNTSDGKLERIGRRMFWGNVNSLQSSQKGQAETADQGTTTDQNGRNSFKEKEEKTKACPNSRCSW